MYRSELPDNVKIVIKEKNTTVNRKLFYLNEKVNCLY